MLAYVEAWDHRDFAAMEAIYPNRDVASRYRAMGTMTHARVTASHPATALELAVNSPVTPGEHYTVQITATFTGLIGSDLAYSDGPAGWSYSLERSDQRQPWQIADSGS